MSQGFREGCGDIGEESTAALACIGSWACVGIGNDSSHRGQVVRWPGGSSVSNAVLQKGQ